LKVDDTPRARSKNLDVLKEWEKVEKKNEANFVVIGMLFVAIGLVPAKKSQDMSMPAKVRSWAVSCTI
jgi:hypothetical protein